MKIDRSVLEQNNQNIGDLGDPDKLEASITHLADVIDSNDNDTSTLKTDNTSNKSRLTTAETNITNLQTDNASNKSRLTPLEGDNSTNKNRLTVLEGDNSSNKQRITTNEGNIAYTEAQLTNLLRENEKASEVVAARQKADGTTYPLLGDRLNNVDMQLEDIVSDTIISPEHFEGNDLQKLQQALDYCLINKTGMKLTKMYDVTGLGPIYLNQDLYPSSAVINVLGEGGGITKNDGGYLFTSNVADVGVMVFSKVHFKGTPGTGLVLFDTNKLIVITLDHCSYRYVDAITYTDDIRQYIQSIRIIGGRLIGGSGYAFDFAGAYDSSFDNITVENRESFMRQRYLNGVQNGRLVNVRIRDCMTESLSGTAYKLSNATSLVMDGNYMEANGSNIEFDPNSLLESVEINNCIGIGSAAPLVKWGGTLQKVKTNNNVTDHVAVHDTTNVISGTVQSDCDVSRDNIKNIYPVKSTINSKSDWITNGALSNNWLSVGTSFGYREGKDGKIEFKGIISDGTTAASTLLMNLPIELRPTKLVILKAMTYDASQFKSIPIEVDTNGNIQIHFLATALKYISFDGLSFSKS